MVKQKLEKKFREAMNADADLWGMKLHNNPLSHQTTPADFIVDYEKMDLSADSLQLHLVECKQVTCDERGKGRLAFKRLKQLHDLLAFTQKRPYTHFSWFCVVFKESYWAQSDVYLIPAATMQTVIESSSMVSVNRQHAASYFKDFKVPIVNGFMDLSALKR